ncbi:hypothetical protein CWY48_004101 [Salmonella enterica subsp. enterica serovar Typhimurium var. 5-]|nr:hypothetical protein [Salmonella enterica subsp. enterica serovar Typhimurium var. 5-]
MLTQSSKVTLQRKDRIRCPFHSRKRLEGRSSEKGDGLAYTVTDASRER